MGEEEEIKIEEQMGNKRMGDELRKYICIKISS